MAIFKNKAMIYIIGGIVAASIPQFLEIGRSTMTMLNMVVIYSIIAIGFNILLGYAGQISLGHAAFMGIGAYVSANITAALGDIPFSFTLSLLLAGVIPMLIGLLLGLVALRLEGHYLAIATLGFGVAVQQVFKEWIGFTNGFSGLSSSYPRVFTLFTENGYLLKDREDYFILSISVFVILAILAQNILKAKTGRALIAMRDGEHAAQAMGVSLFKYKLIAFALSAFYAGIAGSLYVHLIRYTEPNQWGIDLSLNLLAMVVIGGLASIEGSILGAAFIVLIPEFIKEVPFLENIKNFSSILTGLSLILVIMFFPHGLARIGSQIKLLLLNRKNKTKTNGA